MKNSYNAGNCLITDTSTKVAGRKGEIMLIESIRWAGAVHVQQVVSFHRRAAVSC